jgi:hypothetical protein
MGWVLPLVGLEVKSKPVMSIDEIIANVPPYFGAWVAGVVRG